LSSINDNIKRFTGGNSVPDGLADWYSKTGTEALDDAEHRWLTEMGATSSLSIPDKWFELLRARGYTGSLTSMYNEYWANPPILADLRVWTRFNSCITEGVSGVSQWNDVSSNGNHLKQATDANRMTKEADGSILGNGVDQFLQTDAFTLVQPEMIYLLLKQVTWTAGDRIFDGNAYNSGLMNQSGTTPQVGVYAGAPSPSLSDLILDTYGVVTVLFNGASSVFQIDKNTAITGNFGASNMGGFILGANALLGEHSNIQVKEVIIYSTAHDAATRAKVIAYLSNVGGL